MKKSDLKRTIKPLVKECIQEILIEEGLLSNIVSEVVKGMSSNTITETARAVPQQLQQADPTNNHSKRLREQRESLLGALNKGAYNGVNIFEGTEPLTNHEARESSPGSIDLGDPRDAGVDINSILGDSSRIWKAMK